MPPRRRRSGGSTSGEGGAVVRVVGWGWGAGGVLRGDERSWSASHAVCQPSQHHPPPTGNQPINPPSSSTCPVKPQTSEHQFDVAVCFEEKVMEQVVEGGSGSGLYSGASESVGVCWRLAGGRWRHPAAMVAAIGPCAAPTGVCSCRPQFHFNICHPSRMDHRHVPARADHAAAPAGDQHRESRLSVLLVLGAAARSPAKLTSS